MAQAKVRLECLECGRKFSVSPNANDPRCPKCGSVDWDVIEHESQSSKHCDAGYMNDMRFGE